MQYGMEGVVSNTELHVIPTDSRPQQPAAALSLFTKNKFNYISDLSNKLEGRISVGHSAALTPVKLFETVMA